MSSKSMIMIDLAEFIMFNLGNAYNYRVLNGFLNTGKGGTAYLGIVDNGRVKGICMTQFQVQSFSQFYASISI